ncbi:MAG TPA: hypothetical protein VE978_23795 [Chitinophagales bacterium]|nr:hypothetical protein [Chitinophagales bacterium]
MTLIVTYINRHGIIHASDSNLTNSNDENAGSGQKTFAINYLNAGMTVAGSYSVGGIHMDVWLNDFIPKQEFVKGITLEKFSRALKDELQAKMTASEKEGGSMIHIAGYVEANGKVHPEFWFITNVHGMNEQTGEYENVDETFGISEDFWNRDCQRGNIMAAFKNENIFSRAHYFNGFSSGRMGYHALTRELEKFFLELWRVPGWKFRPPKSLDDTERLVKLYMQIITELFVLSDYPARYIGGGIQTFKIPQPANIVDECIA